MKPHHALLLLTLSVAILAPGVRAHGRKAGSLLVFPSHYAGSNGSTGEEGGALLFAMVSVTNLNMLPYTPTTLGGATNVRFSYFNVDLNPNDPFHPDGCSLFTRTEYLSPGDTLAVMTPCHNVPNLNGTQQGYLIVIAEDPAVYRTPWSHNDLIGSEIVLTATGASWSVNAVSFASPQPDGAPTDVAPANGRQEFNGVEYEAVPDQLYIPVFVGLPGSRLTLVNLTGNANSINTVLFTAWNDNEFPLSAQITFNCWLDLQLQDVSSLFSPGFLMGTPNDPSELDLDCDGVGDFETGWAIIDSIGVTLPGGASLSNDGALLGVIVTSPQFPSTGGSLLWESTATQANGVAYTP